MPPITQQSIAWRTYADCAAQGIWHAVTCLGCRRTINVSCRSMVERGLGHLDVVETKHRLRCGTCGHRGAMISIHGQWVGAAAYQPADWAETVEERMPKN